ncbi:hypothetical protein [Stenotrophomonas acidaminiphila]|jgi:hypothetical protein|uniref:hypothetical protein n=1 Tax=Stenotrophomonas acidaminiphila TaxID=128780 RepID=UPI0024AE5594|nr:hypothetical protein [Stenotrophomonas acidaminiphila]WHL17603.1 hypothetical protein QLF99_11025 [Stenotrophomonas acidaminiphila]
MEAIAHVVVEASKIEADIQRIFGFDVRELDGVAKTVLTSFIQTTKLHPKGFGGTRAWGDGSAAIRAALIPLGWHPEDPQNQPRIVSADQRLAITVSSGSAYTGVADRTPQTRNDKGAQTSVSVGFNARQGELFPVTGQVVPLSQAESGQALWILLYYIDLDNRELRYELSRPTAMSEHDKVNGWSTRYIFSPLRFDADVDVDHLHRSYEDLPDIDIQVTPKN